MFRATLLIGRRVPQAVAQSGGFEGLLGHVLPGGMLTGENWRGVTHPGRGQAEMRSSLSLIPWRLSLGPHSRQGCGLSADGRQNRARQVLGQGNRCEPLATPVRGQGGESEASISRRTVSRIGALNGLPLGETVAYLCWKGKGESVLLMENALGFLERAAEYEARTTGHYRRFG